MKGGMVRDAPRGTAEGVSTFGPRRRKDDTRAAGIGTGRPRGSARACRTRGSTNPSVPIQEGIDPGGIDRPHGIAMSKQEGFRTRGDLDNCVRVVLVMDLWTRWNHATQSTNYSCLYPI
jgi:hypothetical protein